MAIDGDQFGVFVVVVPLVLALMISLKEGQRHGGNLKECICRPDGINKTGEGEEESVFSLVVIAI